MRQRKNRTTRLAHRVILVICEGETEEGYVNILKRYYRLPITIKTKVLGNALNSRLVGQYVRELGASPSECAVFYIYDGDIWSVTEKILKMEGKAIISTPCIELWFGLHTKDLTRPFDSGSIVKELRASHPSWKGYSKGMLTNDQTKLLLAEKEKAIHRAQKLNWLSNPSTNMGDFIDYLESEKSVK